MVLPPGICSSQFQSFITKRKILFGVENVEVIFPDDPLNDKSYLDPCHGHDMHAVLRRSILLLVRLCALGACLKYRGL
jgi:hypothetical protein